MMSHMAIKILRPKTVGSSLKVGIEDSDNSVTISVGDFVIFQEADFVEFKLSQPNSDQRIEIIPLKLG